MKEFTKVLEITRQLLITYYFQINRQTERINQVRILLIGWLDKMSTNKVSKIRRIPYRLIKKLERGYKVNRSSSKKYEEVIWQEIEEFSRIDSWRQYMAKE